MTTTAMTATAVMKTTGVMTTGSLLASEVTLPLLALHWYVVECQYMCPKYANVDQFMMKVTVARDFL